MFFLAELAKAFCDVIPSVHDNDGASLVCWFDRESVVISQVVKWLQFWACNILVG